MAVLLVLVGSDENNNENHFQYQGNFLAIHRALVNLRSRPLWHCVPGCPEGHAALRGSRKGEAHKKMNTKINL